MSTAYQGKLTQMSNDKSLRRVQEICCGFQRECVQLEGIREGFREEMTPDNLEDWQDIVPG